MYDFFLAMVISLSTTHSPTPVRFKHFEREYFLSFVLSVYSEVISKSCAHDSMRVYVHISVLKFGHLSAYLWVRLSVTFCFV